MEITEAQLQRFIALYKTEFNIVLQPVEAHQKASSLLQFLTLSVIPFEITEDGDRIRMPDLK